MDRIRILNMNVEDLREELENLQLDTRGRKSELQDRLLAHLEANNEQFLEAVEEMEPIAPINAVEGVNAVDAVEIASNSQASYQSNFTLKDVQDSLSHFDGNKININQWLQEFEDCATAVQWNELQKFIYGKQLLKGAAQIFVRGQANINNWGKLKAALEKEFGNPLSTAEVHKILATKKKKPKETCLEYLYSIIEVSKSIKLDDESVIDYFIEGIPDSRQNKSMLYESKTISDLKDKIKVYEKVRDKPNNNFNRTYSQEKKHCYNCPHLTNHTTQDCRKSNNSCFKCGKKGHKANDCRSGYRNEEARQNYDKQQTSNNDSNKYQQGNNTRQQTNYNNRNQQNYTSNRQQPAYNNNNNYQRNTSNRQPTIYSNNNNSQPSNNNINRNNEQNDTPNLRVNLSKSASRMFVDMSINGHTFYTLFDTGCDVSIIRQSVLQKLNTTLISPEKVFLTGIGEGKLETLGYTILKVTVKNQTFNWKFHVVNDKDLDLQAIIGNDVIEIMSVHITETGLTFKLREKAEELEEVLIKELLGVPKYNTEFTAGLEFRSLCLDQTIDEDNNLDLGHLDKKLKYELLNEIDNYKIEKTKSPNVTMKIVVTDNIPIYDRPRRLPISDQKIVESQIEKWLEEGIIEPSQSEYAAPIVLVSKKNGEKRLCCDYRKINQKIVRDNFPMTLIDDVLMKLQNAKVFTTFDLKNGFFHVPVDDDSIKYTSFVTHFGQFAFKVSPFGMSNSPAAFCRYITAIFNELILKGTVIIYMDDIVIPSQNEEENLQKIREVLKVASEHGLQINWEKCQFIKNEINFLGYIIKDSSIQPSKEKIKSVANFPQPTNIKMLQQFLGLTSYFRRFIQNYATIAKPLTDLLSKNSNFIFGTDQEIAFAQLKEALITQPVLKIYNPHAQTELHTDASKFGLGGALMQISSDDGCWHPVEYMSRRTNIYEEKYDSYQLEVLAIVAALKKWRIYLLGIHFKIITDCVAFTQTVKKSEMPARITRWVILLQDFDYELEHRKGNKLKHVDALSRMYCYMLSRSLKHRIEQAQENDVWIKNLKECVTDKKHPDFFIKNNLLFKDYDKELLVIPNAMETEIIETAHRQNHFAVKKTMDTIEKDFYIPNLNEKATKIVRNCVECIISDAKSGKKEGLLAPIEKATQPLDTLHLDHVGPLENTKKRYNHILTVVDAFSKFTWLYPTKSTGTQEVVDILEKNAAIFGHPRRIITDRGTAFTSTIFKEYCTENNIVHVLTTTGVPRGNGQVERVHKIVISLLSKLCAQNKQDWYKYLNTIQQTISNSPPRSTKISPFKILTGIDMKVTGLDDIMKLLDEEMLQEFDNSREQLRQTAKENISKIQAENKQNFNKNRKKETEYQIGDMVAIKRTQFGTGLKIKRKYLGPYKITKQKRNGRYEVEKLEEFEGPIRTTNIAENIKPWNTAFGSNTTSGRPNVGTQV